MTKPDISISTTTQVRIQPDPTYWFTVESLYCDEGYDGFTLTFWEKSEGQGRIRSRVYVEKGSALAVADPSPLV